MAENEHIDGPGLDTPVDVVEVFEPCLKLETKSLHSRKHGVNFRRLWVTCIDFAGDISQDLNGVEVHYRGGKLKPAPVLPEGLNAVKDGNSGYIIQGMAPAESPYAVFDFFPDGYSQSGTITIEKDGCGQVEAEFDFSPQPLNWLFDVVESLVWAFFIAMIIRLVLFQTFYIPSGSMEPTLYEGDRIVANKLIYKLRQPNRGEVLIFKVYSYFNEGEMDNQFAQKFMPMGRSSFSPNSDLGERFLLRDYIKRVAALPGDEVEVRNQRLYINGDPVEEPWITDQKYDFNYEFGPETVPEGHLFVLGDNHRNSQDSHKLGYLPISNVVGKALFVFYPVPHIKLIR